MAEAPRRDVFLDFTRNFALLTAALVTHMAFIINVDPATMAPKYINNTPLRWFEYVLVYQMPSFFFVGGTLLFRRGLQGNMREYYSKRLWRLLVPVVVFLGALLALNAIVSAVAPSLCSAKLAGAAPGLECTTGQPMAPLWFLGIYIPFVAITPLWARIWATRFGWLLLPASVLVVIACDAVYFTSGTSALHLLVIGVTTWAIPWMLGFAYAQGRLQRIPRVWLWATCVAMVSFYLLGTSFGPWDLDPNRVPYTLVWNSGSFLAIAALLLAKPWIERFSTQTRAGRWVVGPFGKRVYSVYIWHGLAIFLFNALLVTLNFSYPSGPGLEWLLERPLFVLGPLAILVVFVWLFGWAEDVKVPKLLLGKERRQPPADSPADTPADAAAAQSGAPTPTGTRPATANR